MEVKRSETIDYQQSVKRDSSYRHMVIKQQTGADDATVGNSQITSVFELPAVSMNLAESFLNFNQVVPAQGANVVSNAWRHTPPIARMELLTRGGQYLMDVQNFQEFVLSNGRRNKKIEDVSSTTNNDITVMTAGDRNVIQTTEQSAADTAQTIRWRIAFKELYETCLSLNKSIYLNEVLLLRVTWAPSTFQGWGSAADLTNPADLAGNVVINNLQVLLAQEMNPSVDAALRGAVSGGQGLSMIIPYPHVYKTNISAGTSQSVAIRASRGHGYSLERVYTLFKTGVESQATRFDAKRSEFTSFYNLLNSRRMSEFDYKVAGDDTDIVWLKRNDYKGLIVSAEPENLNDNLCWEDSFCDARQCAINQHVAGLSLEGAEIKYDLYATKANGNATNYFTSLICQKRLSVSPAGLSVL